MARSSFLLFTPYVLLTTYVASSIVVQSYSMPFMLYASFRVFAVHRFWLNLIVCLFSVYASLRYRACSASMTQSPSMLYP